MTFCLLNTISIIATFIVAQGVIYFVLDMTMGKLSILNFEIVKSKIQVKQILFLLLGLYIFLFFFDFYLPWK